MDRLTADERSRFDSKCIRDGTCLLMAVSLDRDGYAKIYFRGRPRPAHRVSYWASVGDIPAGYHVDHICGRRDCVEPAHLRALTAAENARRSMRSTCKRGHPLDREYNGRRYCSTCDREKKIRLRAKWRAEGRDKVLGL